MVPESDDTPAKRFKENVAVDVVRLAAAVAVKVPCLTIDLYVEFEVRNCQVEIAARYRILRLGLNSSAIKRCP